jgi:DNA-binding response OmpR family regulator
MAKYPDHIPDRQVIFLTAKGRDVDIAKGMVLGADEYITKPFSNQQIIDAVKKLLEEPE